jgi:hypothetical protein
MESCEPPAALNVLPWPVAAPKNRVGGSAAFSFVFAFQYIGQTLDTPAENGGCGYDFASGIHKYLYAEDDPVDNDDPSGNDDVSIGNSLDSMSMAVYSKVFQSSLNNLESLGGVSAASAPYPVVVVTAKGTQYEPKTTVKTATQAGLLGLHTGDQIHIPVPSTVSPQGLVDTWAKKPSVVYDAEFFWYWRPGGENDYKVTISPIYDAFGNFEYGATGAGRGMLYSTLQAGGAIGHWKQWFHNNPINTADIKSGFDAISSGGKLSVKEDSLQ